MSKANVCEDGEFSVHNSEVSERAVNVQLENEVDLLTDISSIDLDLEEVIDASASVVVESSELRLAEVAGRNNEMQNMVTIPALRLGAGLSFDKDLILEAPIVLAESERRTTYWASLTSMILGILAWLMPFLGLAALFSLLALIFGAMGLGKSGASKEYKGGGMAITGFILGTLAVLILGLAIAAVA